MNNNNNKYPIDRFPYISVKRRKRGRCNISNVTHPIVLYKREMKYGVVHLTMVSKKRPHFILTSNLFERYIINNDEYYIIEYLTEKQAFIEQL